MTRPRGLTLVETLVVSTLLLLVAAMGYWVQRTGYAAYRQRERRDEAERTLLLSMERIRSELDRGARVSVVQGELHLLFPLTRNGQVLVGAAGQPQYGSDEVVYRVQPDGSLVRRQGSAAPRLIGRLGKAGQAEFTLLPPDLNVLQIAMVVDDPASPCRQTSRVYLRNQP